MLSLLSWNVKTPFGMTNGLFNPKKSYPRRTSPNNCLKNQCVLTFFKMKTGQKITSKVFIGNGGPVNLLKNCIYIMYMYVLTY